MKKLFILCLTLCMAFATQAAELLYGPYVQAITEDSAYIVWVTDKATYGWVEVKAQDGKKVGTFIESHIGLKHNRRVHRVPVKNLQPGTAYEYKIFSQEEEKGGNLLKPISSDTNVHGHKHTFRTNDRNKEEISFTLIADTHYNNYVTDLFSKLITPERIADKDFVMFDGDMVTTMSSEKTHFERLFSEIHDTFAHHNTQFYYIRGNHEARGNFAGKYMDYYPTWTGMPYYSFRHGPVFFVVLDGGEDKPDSDIEYYGTAAFDLYREEQGKWLETVLNSEECKSATYRVIISHIPLNNNSWHGGRHAWEHLCKRCDEHGFDVMISGHIHKYRFVEKGRYNKNFPTLIVGADRYLEATANKDALTLEVKLQDGSVFKTFTFPAKK